MTNKSTGWLFAADRTPAPPYQPGSETSRIASEAVAPKAGSQRERVLACLRQAKDGLTRHELSYLAQLPLQTICARVHELLDAGLVRVEGTRMGPYGKPAEVLLAKERP